MDRVIYRDYIVNQRFFIYCSLASIPMSQWGRKRGKKGLRKIRVPCGDIPFANALPPTSSGPPRVRILAQLHQLKAKNVPQTEIQGLMLFFLRIFHLVFPKNLCIAYYLF